MFCLVLPLFDCEKEIASGGLFLPAAGVRSRVLDGSFGITCSSSKSPPTSSLPCFKM